MHTILLVDDELHVLQYLSELLSTACNMEIQIREASSVKKAMCILEEVAVDVIVTDYRMPGRTGLDLLDYVSREFPRTRVVFLSAYRDFDYIYNATALGAIRYILKTEDDDTIVNTVRDIIESLGQDEPVERSFSMDAAIYQYLNQCSYVDRFIATGEIAQDSIFDFRRSVVPAILHLYEPIPTHLRTNRLRLRCEVQLLAQKQLSQYESSLVLETETGILYVLIQGHASRKSEDIFETDRPGLSRAFDLLHERCHKSLGLRIGFLVAPARVHWSALNSTIESLAVSDWELDLLDSVEAHAVSNISATDVLRSEEDQALVRRIKAFVLSHLDRDLSLTAISRAVYYSPHYVSRSFRLSTGMRLSAYIAKHRLKRAKTLLATTDWSVADVARASGFGSAQYFASVFRATVGLRPRAYRRRVHSI